MKGKAVDTVYIKDTDPEYRQIKVFHKGNVAWIDNVTIHQMIGKVEVECMENLKSMII